MAKPAGSESPSNPATSSPDQSDLFSQPPEPTEEAKAIARLRHEILEETESLQAILEPARPLLRARRSAWDALIAEVANQESTPESRKELYDSKDFACRAARPWINRLKQAEAIIRDLEKDLDALLGPTPGKRVKKAKLNLLPPEVRFELDNS